MMKKSSLMLITFLLVLLLGLGGYGYNHLSSKLNSMTNIIDALNSKNLTLKQQNKNLTTNNKKLKSTNKTLRKNNTTLTKRQNNIKKKITMQRKKIVTRNIDRVKNKLATAGAKMAPFLGIPIVVGAVTLDINDYCSDIKDMETFEYELFGTPSLANSEYHICGIDAKKQLDATANSVNKSYEALLYSFNHTQENTSKYWDLRLRELKSYMNNTTDDTKWYWNNLYNNTLDFYVK